MNLTGRFIIDGYDLYEAFRVVVQEADGLDVLPKVKKRTEYDWPEESGVDVDTTTDLTYEAHDITLDCYVQESTYADAVKRINGVVKLLSSDGLHLLGSQLRQRLYPVLLQEVTGYKRITPAHASAIYVQFTLKLRCPMPETRIGSVTVEASEQVTLAVPTGKDFTVWWGDGTVNENTLTHTYAEAGTYTVLIAGTGVTSVVITGINVAEFSYPATGDITHVDVSHTSEEAWQMALALLQAVNDAINVADDAYTTAAEAAQAINEHAQAATNPHPDTTSQTFAAVTITPLKSDASGGSIPAVIYTWFKGLFASLVDGLVVSFFVGILTVLKDLATRVGLLEDKFILRYVVPVDTNVIILTTDKNGGLFNFQNGTELEISFNFNHPPSTNGVELCLLNSEVLEASKYVYSTTPTSSFPTTTASQTNAYNVRGKLTCVILNDEAFLSVDTHILYSGNTYAGSLFNGRTVGKNMAAINKITFIRGLSGSILAGSEILIHKK